jgi:acyl carrier protein
MIGPITRMRDVTHIEHIITTFIVEEIAGRGAVIDPEENIFTSGHVDSVGIMRLIAHLESTLDVTIPPTELVPQNFRTVRVMAAYLASRAS